MVAGEDPRLGRETADERGTATHLDYGALTLSIETVVTRWLEVKTVGYKWLSFVWFEIGLNLVSTLGP